MARSALLRRFRHSWSLFVALAATPAFAVDLGEATVLSMQGQRLKIAVPYGSAPGEVVPVLRFMVESVESLDGTAAPAAGQFVISQPEFRNVVYLQSLEPVQSGNLRLTLSVANAEGARVAYDLKIPPLAYAATPYAAPSASAARSGSRHKRKLARSGSAKALAQASRARPPRDDALLKASVRAPATIR